MKDLGEEILWCKTYSTLVCDAYEQLALSYLIEGTGTASWGMHGESNQKNSFFWDLSYFHLHVGKSC